ncbi:MAG: ABC transporter ATP-binding protein [Betaproteobacteria bacterium]
MLQLTGLTKTYRTEDVETTALDAVDLSIAAGEFVAVMGPSGCGKSTLLNLVGMLDTPTRGQYVFEGTDISGYSERQLAELRKRRLGFIFQSFNLIDDLTVRENIELALLYQRVDGRERAARVDEIMDRVGIAHRARHRPPQLSGGQQQRVAEARALANDPALVFADEPTGSLDQRTGTDLADLLFSLAAERRTTLVVVTHDERVAARCARRLRLVDGRVQD